MMEKKIMVMTAVAGVAMMAQAGLGDFLRKAAAITDIVTDTTNATTVVAVGQQTAAVADTETPSVVNEEVSMDELAKRLAADPSLLVIDVRTASEYASGHIPNAKNISVDSIGSKIGKVVPNKDTPVYVYCLSGSRSTVAAQTLVGLGYRRVYDAGAISEWSGKLSR